MYHHLLVTVAYDKGHDAGPALEIARALAAPGAQLTLLHVMEPAPFFALDYLPEGYRDELRAAIDSDLHALVAETANAEAVVTEGAPAHEILETARDLGVDCIVISSHRPGHQGLFLGSTASKVVARAQCAVHVARRAGQEQTA